MMGQCINTEGSGAVFQAKNPRDRVSSVCRSGAVAAAGKGILAGYRPTRQKEPFSQGCRKRPGLCKGRCQSQDVHVRETIWK